MNINSMNSHGINQLQSMQALGAEQSLPQKTAITAEAPTGQNKVNISQAGQVGSYMANLPKEQQQEVKDYLQSVREAKADGSFDIAASIKDAPAAFNDLAKQLNLSNEETLDVMAKMPAKGPKGTVAEQAKAPGVAAYADVAAQTKDSGSIIDRFTSLFSSDTKAKV
jgi:hypothetical protein